MRTVIGGLALVVLLVSQAQAAGGIDFARQWMPWALDPHQVELYLGALKSCESGDMRYCRAIDFMFPATTNAQATTSGTRCLSVPIGDGSFATRCF